MTSLRDRVLDAYVSTSPGVHRPAETSIVDRYIRSYQWYLRGWLDARGAWLDLGCGQGSLLELAKRSGCDPVLGVDASPEMVEVALARGHQVQLGRAMDFLRSEREARWDVVSLFDVLEHVSRDDGLALLEEIRRVLRPGGVCIVKLPNAESPWGFHVTASDLTHEAAYSPTSLTQIATVAGFVRCEVREVPPTPLGFKSVVRRALWVGLRAAYAGLHVIETGSPGSGIYTRVMLARLCTR